MNQDNYLKLSQTVKLLANLFNIFVLIGSLVIIVTLSLELLYPAVYARDALFQTLQFYICLVFLADFILQFIISKRKWRYIKHNFIFLLVSIPYLAILSALQWSISDHVYYFLRIVLLLRGGFGLIIVVSWITSSRVSNLFLSYLIILIAITYFSSIVFYSVESRVNGGVTSYWDALWWACMDVTTVGSNVSPVTVIGRVLSVLLAGMGMCMFPIFTAFITTKFQQTWTPKQQANTTSETQSPQQN